MTDMRVPGLLVVVLAAGPAAAADAADRSNGVRYEERLRVSPAAARHYGPQVALPGVTEQVVVRRGLRLLLETDDRSLFPPVLVTRRLPSTVDHTLVEAEFPLYERTVVETRSPKPRRSPARRAARR